MITRYNAKDCSIMVGGTDSIPKTYITGLGEDMVTGSKDEDFYEASVGAQGDIIACEVNNTLGEITVAVQPTSPQKQFLMNLAGINEFFPVWVVNKSLGERFGGTMAKVKSFPEMSRGATAEDMEFVFGIFDYTVDGNV